VRERLKKLGQTLGGGGRGVGGGGERKEVGNKEEPSNKVRNSATQWEERPANWEPLMGSRIWGGSVKGKNEVPGSFILSWVIEKRTCGASNIK